MLQKNDGTFSVGCCNNEDKTIYLNKNLNGFFLKKVLTHEISHAALFSYHVKLPIQIEEEAVDIIATYGYEIVHITNMIYSNIKKEQHQ